MTDPVIRRGTAQRLGLVLPAIGQYLLRQPDVTWPPTGTPQPRLLGNPKPMTEHEFTDGSSR